MNIKRAFNFTKTIAAAATPERLSDTSKVLYDVRIHGDQGNTGTLIMIGASDVSLTNGSQKGTPGNKPGSLPGVIYLPGPVDLKDLWGAVGTDGDKIVGCGFEID